MHGCDGGTLKTEAIILRPASYLGQAGRPLNLEMVNFSPCMQNNLQGIEPFQIWTYCALWQPLRSFN